MVLRSIFRNCVIQNQINYVIKNNSVKNLSVLYNLYTKKQFYVSPNLEYNVKYFHTTFTSNQKLRFETENNHVYQIMQSLPSYKNNLASNLLVKSDEQVSETNDFNSILNSNFRQKTANEIVNTFKKVLNFAKINNISLDDTRFNNLIDGLMDNCQNLTDAELAELLYIISQYPKSATDNRNFNDIWSALDDISCQRMQNWSIQKTLQFMDFWYILGLTRYCDYSFQALKKLCRKIRQLSSSELVQTLFYVNVCRKQWSMYDFEVNLEEKIKDLSLNEMAVVSMAFFKTQTPFKGTFLTTFMIGKILENVSTIHEITLTSLLKIIRYSPHLHLADQIKELLTQLVPEIDRLSTLCCVHIALLGTNIQLFHPEVLTKICEKFAQNINSVRLKDLERLTFTLSLFKFVPKTNILDLIVREVQKPERKDEIEKHPRCLSCLTHYLGLLDIYSYDLINQVLNPDFITKAYGKHKMSIGREILFLDQSIDIDCPNYSGNRLPKKVQKNLAKWNSDWIPSRNQKQRLTATDKLMLEILETLQVIFGKTHINFILPHFSKPDLIVCTNKFGNPLSVNLDKYHLGDIMKPDLQDNLIWYAVIVGGWNMFIRGTEKPVGTLAKKIQQLEKIGYVPIVIPWSPFLHLSGKEKEELIKNKFSSCTKIYL